jgi:hypothetical protein
MVTRIPQPQFIGSAPSDVVQHAQDLGQRYAAMYQQGMQETAKNYLTQKQIDVEKQKAEAQAKYNDEMTATRASAEQQAKQFAVSKEFEANMTKIDPSEHYKFLLENKPLAMQYATNLAGGDKDLGKQFYDSMLMTSVDIASGKSMIGAGAFGFQQQPQGQPQAITGSPTPAVPPGAPMPASPQMTQNANPVGSPTAPAGVPAAPAPSRIQPSTVGQTPSGLGTATSQTSQAGSLVESLHITTSNPRSDLGQAVIRKFEQGAFTSDDTVTPKEDAAARSVLKPTLKVLEDSNIVKDLEKEGVTSQMLQQKVDILNKAMDADPQFRNYLTDSVNLSPTAEKAFLEMRKQDATFEEARAKLGLQQEANDIKKGDLALNAAKIEGMLKLGFERAQTSGDKVIISAYAAANAAMTAYSQHWVAELQRYQETNKDNPRALKPDKVSAYMNKLFADKSNPLNNESNWTSYLIARATGINEEITSEQIQGSNGFLFGWGSEPDVTVTHTGVPGVTTPSNSASPQGSQQKPLQGPAPAANKIGPDGLTDRQRENMKKGQAPGPA